MRRSWLVVALVAVPMIAAVGHSATTHKATSQTAPAARYSPEKLAKIRQSLVAQIAVHDQADGAMRAPTAEEAAALTGSTSPAAEVVYLDGGVALHRNVSQMSFAIAALSDDGAVSIAHGTPARIGANQDKGGAHVR